MDEPIQVNRNVDAYGLHKIATKRIQMIQISNAINSLLQHRNV